MVKVELVEEEVVGVHDLEVERLDGVRREVLRVGCHEHLSAAANGSREDVPFLLVVRHCRHQVVIVCDHRVGEVVLHRAEALLNERQVLAVLHEVLRQLEQDVLRPQRSEQAAVREFQDEVVEQRPIEDVGVKGSRKPYLRVKLRKTLDVSRATDWNLRPEAGALQLSQRCPALGSELRLVGRQVFQSNTTMTAGLS